MLAIPSTERVILPPGGYSAICPIFGFWLKSGGRYGARRGPCSPTLQNFCSIQVRTMYGCSERGIDIRDHVKSVVDVMEDVESLLHA